MMVPKSLDEPVQILGLSPDEFFGGALSFLLFYFQNHPTYGLLAAIMAVFTLKRIKAGKNDGFMLHKIYEYGFPLPGLLPPYVNHFED